MLSFAAAPREPSFGKRKHFFIFSIILCFKILNVLDK